MNDPVNPTHVGQLPGFRHQARKRFGQNFLRSSTVIDRIIASIRPGPSDHIVEIGPGQGAITAGLLDSGALVSVVELDRDLIPLLKIEFATRQNLRIHEADALRFDFASLLTEGESGPSAGLRVVGNLPYNISTPLIFKLLEYRTVFTDMHFMLQREVVERLAAEPGSKTYGRLSVMTQHACRVEQLFDVPPTAFVPAPKVWSAIVRLQPLPRHFSTKEEEAVFANVVQHSFSMRRKTIRNNLKGIATDEQMASVGIDPGCRAETLSGSSFVKLAELLIEERKQKET
ncbi:MAG: 16S rRNA (adenine(1518)-N(6)/adenine(1519)-N(6))-dimethyltransferase [unclassified Hahellaceae]|nr:16S rRNA (adenine(1518)-N(6)/adenine(1519)-N(6))-dimethyltransferase [Hahellaceae bacterium]|tara:strand:+ start:9147 stop:10007 length:861 start_codon:yes stop_codon:yes gene_type:complete